MEKAGVIRIASILCWLWGVLLLISAAAIGIPLISKGQNPVFPLMLGLMGILFCISGHGMRKGRGYSRWLALVSSIGSSAMLIMVRFPISPAGLVICAVIVILVAMNWKSIGN
jgi:hypothetical protein